MPTTLIAFAATAELAVALPALETQASAFFGDRFADAVPGDITADQGEYGTYVRRPYVLADTPEVEAPAAEPVEEPELPVDDGPPADPTA